MSPATPICDPEDGDRADGGRAVQVNLDGEPISGKTLRFEVLAGVLDACLPEEAPVLGP
jgi:diacylglycerol kinase family enzyme